jgi:hypothetical protein
MRRDLLGNLQPTTIPEVVGKAFQNQPRENQ